MYVGYPISLKTAFTIFGYKEPEGDATAQYNTLREHLKNYSLDLYFYDKNVYILGLRLMEFDAARDFHYPVEHAAKVISGYSSMVKRNLILAGARIQYEFDIEVLEGEPERVQHPEPYLIT